MERKKNKKKRNVTVFKEAVAATNLRNKYLVDWTAAMAQTSFTMPGAKPSSSYILKAFKALSEGPSILPSLL